MKKLIPALCMLLVAACLMGTSTYAWFAANESVTASGMQVKAAADGGLAIASYKGNVGTALIDPESADFAASADAIWTNIADDKSIMPTSTSNGVWFSAAAATQESYAVDTTKGYKKVATYNNTDDEAFLAYALTVGSYAQVAKFQVKSMDTDNAAKYDLKVSGITVTEPTTTLSDSLNNAIRVAVKCGDEWFFFSPLRANDNTYRYVAEDADATVGDGEAIPYAEDGIKLYGSNSINSGVVISEVLTNQPMDVEVYVYYEGEDEACTTQAIRLGVDALGVSIKFSATKK